MKSYKIESLGVSYSFIENIKEDFDFSNLMNPVLVNVSERADFSIKQMDATSLEDLLRSFQIYLTRVKGYPSSEYDLELEGRVIRVPTYRDRYGGFLTKCKLLFTDMISYRGITVPVEYYLSSGKYYGVCHSGIGDPTFPSDMLRRLSSNERSPDLSALLFVYERNGTFSVIGASSDKNSFGAPSLAAVYYSVKDLLKPNDKRITFLEEETEGEVFSDCVCAFTKSAHASRLYF
jgi:hypothetical protein